MDQGIVPLGAETILRGGHLYRDFDILHWPGSYWLLALFFKLFGSTWFVCRSVLLAELLLISLFLLIISRQVINGWLVLLPPALFCSIAPIYSNANYHHWDTLLFYLGFILALTPLLKKRQSSWLRPFLAGILAGFSALCFQPFGLAALIACFAFAIIHYQIYRVKAEALKLCIWAGAGLAYPIAIFFLYMISIHDLAPMLNCTVKFLFAKYSQVNIVPYGYSLFFDRGLALTGLIPHLEFYCLAQVVLEVLAWLPHEITKDCPFILAGGVAYFLLRISSLKQAITMYPKSTLWLVAGFALWSVELHRPDLARLCWGSQLLVIVLFALIEKGLHKTHPLRLALRIGLSVLILGIVVDLSLNQALCHSAQYVIATRRGTITCRQDLSVIPAIEKLTKPNDRILVYPWETIIYYLSETRPPARCAYLQYNYHGTYDFLDTIAAMEKMKIPYVVWDMTIGNESFSYCGFPNYRAVPRAEMLMERYLEQNYVLVKRYGMFRLLARKSTPTNSH